MGKGTDKLYITHSEWASGDAFGASAGSKAGKQAVDTTFKRLPYNYCAVSLQPFSDPVCTENGTIFDLSNILAWLAKHRTNPVDGTPLKRADLIKLNFAKNDDGEYVDPVTFKVFTDNTHIVALKVSGNVFAWDTVQRLNIKAKNWKDLVTDQEFTRKDIITLQDPHNIEARNLSSFQYLKEGEKPVAAHQDPDESNGINASALGSSAKILRAKEAVAKARAERATEGQQAKGQLSRNAQKAALSGSGTVRKLPPKNAAHYTTGQAAASFTSTGLTPQTDASLAILSDEEYMLKPKRVKHKGYAILSTNLGDLKVELYPEWAPRAVWNFIRLGQKGYYRNIDFHRNIRNFMLQGGDPTGSGRGGSSIWGKPFVDEIEGPLAHDGRGMLSMANKGKNTNTSQFFITYRACPHLDRKHTIFGKVVDNLDVLARLEAVKTDDKDRPTGGDGGEAILQDVTVLIDPFEEFMKESAAQEAEKVHKEEVRRQGGTEDDKLTWTGKRVRGTKGNSDGASTGVGKYLKAAMNDDTPTGHDEIIEEWDEPEQPMKKKGKISAGFGNFDSW
ncbi:cyclophilin-like protein [Eremomyces bilateralis CBS 781.70]|uniref:Peptidyl-prolyl cis-trans isomerase-like 2 n=1 Tax=Eremomyces bilateralis CBS 781.70 TaxID=1392243 RepID=A0A6G1GBK1_9PEZI|nr:cyclophilin-like protein [Eremomyces bilateralis CBS 781.70]KAF1815280.1 cyclophilin-like protein [Eremomyces bilateralis CBS 781.70]